MMDVISQLRGGLVVSTQAAKESPLHNPVVIAALAYSAEAAGCVGHRVNGAEHVRAVRAVCRRPIIGINKVQVPGYEVYIGPTFESAREVAEAGADLIAIDGTQRPRPEGVTLRALIERIHRELGLPVMADCSNVEEGQQAAADGADLVASTMAGYTSYTAHLRTSGPDVQMIRDLVATVKVPVVGEGRFHHPEDVAAGFAAGAWYIVVGTAITSPGWITEQFVKATPGAAAK